MRTVYVVMILLLAVLPAWGGTKITRTYSQLPLPEVLIDIDNAAPEIDIRFIYNKLEDYPVTCSISNATPLEAIQMAVGFYPVKVTQNGKSVIVEPVLDIDRKLSGRIVDGQGGPLEFANVALCSLADSSLIVGGVANVNGDFVIPCEEERVVLRASYIGYQTVERECAVGSVGTIVLQEDAIRLAEVSKSATRQLARMERGALVYDMVQLLNVLPADDAYEALTRIPGVNEVNGNMEFAGQQVTLIVNGKATTLDAEQMKERLRQMPTERLAKCEVMMSAPARYHVRGAVINIVTKDLYGQHHLSGQLRGAGIFSKRNVGFGSGALLWANGRLSLEAGYTFKGGGQYGRVEHQAVQPLTTAPKSHYDMTESVNNFTHHSMYAQMEYAFAPNHRIGLVYNGQWNDNRNHNVTSGTRPSEQRSTTKKRVNNVDVCYESPFGLKLGASYMHFTYPQTQNLDNSAGTTTSAEREQSGISLQGNRQNFHSHSGQNIDKWDITADQTHTFAHDWTLGYGAEMKRTKHESWQETHLVSGAPVDEATSRLGYTERITSGYASLSKDFGKKVGTELGAQAENYHTPQWNEWRVYPTMNLLWKPNVQNSLNLAFSSKSKYPSYWSLMSNVFYSSTYSEIWGNPQLNPQSSYDASLTWQLRQRYTFTAFYSYYDNFFVQLPYQPSDRMAVVMQEVNFDYRQVAGLVASAQWKLGTWANGSARAAMIYTHDRSGRFHNIPFDRGDLSGHIAATAAIRPFARHNLTLMLHPEYQFGTIQGVYDIRPLFSLDASLRWTDRTGRLSATLAAQNITNFHFQTTDTWRGQDFSMSVWQKWRTVQLSLTYRLAGYKAKLRKQVDTSRMGH